MTNHMIPAWAVEQYHAARPGPYYWDFKCLICDEPVKDHPPLWMRLARKLRAAL